jgi:hypothetical protein
VLGALAAALLWFVSHKLHYFLDYSLASYSDYLWPRRAGLIPHLTGGALAISVGLVQIWLGLTNRVNTLHRVLGKVCPFGLPGTGRSATRPATGRWVAQTNRLEAVMHRPMPCRTEYAVQANGLVP